MANIRHRILVIDVESTCWRKQGRKISEIIEIGITPMDRLGYAWKIGATESIGVRPIFSTVSPFCTELTGWTQEEAEKGISHTDAINKLITVYDSKNSIIACWGKYDDKMFQQMAQMHKNRYPFNNDYLNVKALYAAKFGDSFGVSRALEYLGMEFIGTPHRGSDDSLNIAHILLKLLEN